MGGIRPPIKKSLHQYHYHQMYDVVADLLCSVRCGG